MKAQHSVQEIRSSLKTAGIQPSASRMAIASYVWNTDSHPSVEEVKHEVEKTFPTVSLATVYNTLNLLVEKGLLKEIQDPKTRRSRYDCNIHPHYHFVDESTGRIMDLDPELLQISPDFSKLSQEFEIREIEITLRGRKIKAPSESRTNQKPKRRN
jgi:Fe2+ or Zn2+ uptake regulation protein